MSDINRRFLLKAAGISLLGSLLPPVGYLSSARAQAGILNQAASPAKRWGMAVDMGKCPAECKDCIDACHNLHNVPTIEKPGEEIRWIQKVTFPNAFPNQENPYADKLLRDREVIVTCNHCNNPPCVRVCPTQATFRRNDGIVIMDYHRCIGCRFCIAACPYGARSMNFKDPRPFIKRVNPEYPTRTHGVVEKCNFCEERLAKNQQPACVSACRYQALFFGDIAQPKSEIRNLISGRQAIRRRPELGTDPHIFYIG